MDNLSGEDSSLSLMHWKQFVRHQLLAQVFCKHHCYLQPWKKISGIMHHLFHVIKREPTFMNHLIYVNEEELTCSQNRTITYNTE